MNKKKDELKSQEKKNKNEINKIRGKENKLIEKLVFEEEWQRENVGAQMRNTIKETDIQTEEEREI